MRAILVLSLAMSLSASLCGCGLFGDAPVENGLSALRAACEAAGAPDLDTCAELLKAEARRVAE